MEVDDPGGVQLMEGVLEGEPNLMLGVKREDVLIELVGTNFFAAFA